MRGWILNAAVGVAQPEVATDVVLLDTGQVETVAVAVNDETMVAVFWIVDVCAGAVEKT